jgi:HrpA-like RNA helicase
MSESQVSTSGHNWPDGRWRTPLPVDPRLNELIDLLINNQVVVAEADPGAGKTLRFPQALVLYDPKIHVWLSQPRRNAIRWNGARMAFELGCKPGALVGWRLRGEDPLESNATRLHLSVDRSLINSIIRSSGQLPEGIIIVDEAHERTVYGDMLLGLIGEALPHSPRTKLLVTSATIDTQKFSAFHGGAPIMSIKGRVYPVRTEVVCLLPGEHHTDGASRAALMVMGRFLRGELTVRRWTR